MTRASLPRMIDSMVNAPEFRTALWGILIVDPEKHDTLYAHNAAKLFIPLFNKGLSSIRVRSGASIGDPAVVETRPAKTFPSIRVIATTVARDTSATLGDGRGARGGTGTRVSAYHDTLTSAVVVRGPIALGDSATISFPQHDPNSAFVAALMEALGERGIAVDRQGTPWSQNPQVDSLFTVLSVPLEESLPAIMKPSQNQIAEVFLRCSMTP